MQQEAKTPQQAIFGDLVNRPFPKETYDIFESNPLVPNLPLAEIERQWRNAIINPFNFYDVEGD